jgi:hypothetical protein
VSNATWLIVGIGIGAVAVIAGGIWLTTSILKGLASAFTAPPTQATYPQTQTQQTQQPQAIGIPIGIYAA